MTLEEFIDYFNNASAIGFSFTETQQLAEWLEELKDLRERYKNVSLAYIKCNLELYRLQSKNDNAPTIEERPKMNGVFMASPTEIIKVGEPLSNSDEIKQAFEQGEIYKRGFEEVKKVQQELDVYKKESEEENSDN